MSVSASASPFACVVRAAEVEFVDRKLCTPLELSTGRIEFVVEAQVRVTVELANGRRGVGRGSVYLSDLWAWPHGDIPQSVRAAALRELVTSIANELPAYTSEALHPLALGLRLHAWVSSELPAGHGMPALARMMCGSPFDAAIHDAVGVATGKSAFAFYEDGFPLPSVDGYFANGNASTAVRRVIQPTKRELPAWWVVNKSDVLPDSLARPVRGSGYQRFKLKITGEDAAVDAARTADVYRAARSLGLSEPKLVVDSNEANPDEQSVLEYLDQLRAIDVGAYEALMYLEQPTDRDIARHSCNWREVAAQKPVMLDEGLIDLARLPLARKQNWSGLALKTCKGHSLALVAAAWAHEQRMLLSVQDLTNPGVSLIHSALMAAHLPAINGLEANSPQFTPDANADFLPRLACLFEPRGGCHRLPAEKVVGLRFA
jgi:L-alanine-DL-glutamate epimerase-like enolase superfamily enzyme